MATDGEDRARPDDLAAGGPLGGSRALAVVAQVAGALDAAHAAGLVHRDVKPANVLVEAGAGDERAYLSDFGLVTRSGSDPDLTGSAGWVGSVDYVAPEQVRGNPVDGRADIWGLGAVLYFALTGEVPFPRGDTAARLYAAVADPVPSVRGRRPDLPAGMDTVLSRAMAKDPRDRFGSAGDLVDAAQAALALAAGAVRPRPHPSP